MLGNPYARGGATIAIGAAGGAVFLILNLALPWVLGSLVATFLVRKVAGFRTDLPRSWRGYAMVAIGTMLGTSFTSDVVAHAGGWAVSIVAMLLLSLGFGLFAYMVFRLFGGMDRATALFAATPGGLTVVSLLAEQYDAAVNRVALCHTARLVVLLVSAPFIIETISGIDLSDANSAFLNPIEPLDPLRHGGLVLVAIVSWAVARRSSLPSALLLFPLLSSAVLHGSGLMTVHVPPVLSSLAQVVIGAGVGARFADYTLRQILRDGWLAALVGLALALGALAAAWAMVHVTGDEIAPLFLAYLPGGAPELGVVALALMINPAMVAAHHVSRVFLIVAILPVLARRLAAPMEDTDSVSK